MRIRWPPGSRSPGRSTLALDLFAYAIGLLIFWTGWLLLRRFLERPAALLGLAVLAVPPLFLAQWSLITANHPPEPRCVGNLCLLATHTIFVADPGPARAILALGLLAGLGWWTSPLIVVYLAPFAILALRTGLLATARRLVRRRTAPRRASAVALRAAGISRRRSSPCTRRAGCRWRRSVSGSPRSSATSSPGSSASISRRGGRGSSAFLLVAVPLWMVALVGRPAGIGSNWPGCSAGEAGSAAGTSSSGSSPAPISALVLATQRAIDHYYLLPLYSVLPCWMGEFLDWLRRPGPRSRAPRSPALLALNGVAELAGQCRDHGPGRARDGRP